MLRPSPTKIVLTRDEIRHVRGRQAFPRHPYHGRLPTAPRSDAPVLGPVANFHLAQGLPFRARPQAPLRAETSGSDETSSTQSTLPSSLGHDYDQSSETTLSFVGTQGTRQPPAVLRTGHRLREISQQSPGASEGTSDSGSISPFARDVYPTPDEVEGFGPGMELPSTDASSSRSSLERKAEDVGYPGVLQYRVSIGSADHVGTAPWRRALHDKASFSSVSFSSIYRTLGQPSCKSASLPASHLLLTLRDKGPKRFRWPPNANHSVSSWDRPVPSYDTSHGEPGRQCLGGKAGRVFHSACRDGAQRGSDPHL